MNWTEQYRAAQTQEQEKPSEVMSAQPLDVEAIGSWSEHQARTFLQQHGIPVIPATLASSSDEAVEAARALGLPVALKVASPGILHKSDIGGGEVGLTD